jgi:hypothetical protein
VEENLEKLRGKVTVLNSVEDIKADVHQLLIENDQPGYLFIELNEKDEESLPLFLQAFVETRQQFIDKDVLPVIKISSSVTQTGLVLSLFALALQEALNYFCTPHDREEMKEALINTASIIIRNSSPELVTEVIEKEFTKNVVDFLVKT